MKSTRGIRVHKQLLSVITVLSYAAIEAEALQCQDLADDLHEHLAALKQIEARISKNKDSYRRISTTVRN